MSRINKTVLAVVVSITLSLAANPALAQNNLTFDPPLPPLSGWTPLPATCVTIQTLLPGLAPTTPPNFAVLSNAGIRQCNLIQGDAGNDGILIPADAPPNLLLHVDLAFLSNEIGSGPTFNDTAEVFLTVLPTTTSGAPIGFSKSVRVASFSRNMLQPGGVGPLASTAVAGLGGFAAGFPFAPYFIPVGEFKGQRVFLTFTVRNAVDTAVASALAVDSVSLGHFNEYGGYTDVSSDPGPPASRDPLPLPPASAKP
jgi:hypothetical protein